MKRRTFILQAGLAAGGSITNVARAAERIAYTTKPPGGIRWKRTSSSSLYSSVVCDGEPLVTGELPGLLDGRCRLWSEAPEKATHLGPGQTAAKHGPLRVELLHQLRDTGVGLGEDLLEATLIIRNESDRPQQIETVFATSAQPNPAALTQQIYLPLSAAGLNGHKRFDVIGVEDFLFILASSHSHAAKAPQSKEKLEIQATHIVRGKVLEVATKVEKSKIETSPGVHKDTIYTITVEVDVVSKGAVEKKDGKITVLAWQPHTRELNPPGTQGHELIPKKGETATFYLTGGGKEPFEPITPNGVVIYPVVVD